MSTYGSCPEPRCWRWADHAGPHDLDPVMTRRDWAVTLTIDVIVVALAMAFVTGLIPRWLGLA